MSFYLFNLTMLIVVLAVASSWQFLVNSNKRRPSGPPLHLLSDLSYLEEKGSRSKFSIFRNQYLLIYALANLADWLQGSHTYSLYKNTHGLSEPTVAALFATGFLFGGISGTFTGILADSKPVLLFFGRALGGVSTTLLFSVFETWMISQYRASAFREAENPLADVFSAMSIVNGMVAIASGVTAEILEENYGDSSDGQSFLTNLKNGSLVLPDQRVLSIAATTWVFEGSMYLLVYFWSNAIMSARDLLGTSEKPPFGLIFASFMCSMTLGSMAFRQREHLRVTATIDSSQDFQLVLSTSACCLMVAAVTLQESILFWAFCLFEFCVGFYFPTISSLKASFIVDGHRAETYGLMRLPLNLLVVTSLSTVQEGAENRNIRFMACSIMLLLCVLLVRKHIHRRPN
ncbi:uncharacterized protein JN550_011632 [Neoarthrinium moseri]|uniref:uncharacterized protein n=1 Tax=Neoarthrinium moseri TaxID=1658444 RepID=UPI001FDE9CF2|nr:uncharacterized protein JN550_011632 [Neoarthrinium moseri]KAI1860254.1 hypothetical protein JN550_011632 [Neoarthrinium moseri]